jgi:hypothetical protein
MQDKHANWTRIILQNNRPHTHHNLHFIGDYATTRCSINTNKVEIVMCVWTVIL